jgi:hypothetical protein
MSATDEMVEAALREWSKPNDRREGRDIMRAALTAALAVAPKPTYWHRKRRTYYSHVCFASLQASEPCEEGAVLVVYKGDDGRCWARPFDEFHDGRFDALEDQS